MCHVNSVSPSGYTVSVWLDVWRAGSSPDAPAVYATERQMMESLDKAPSPSGARRVVGPFDAGGPTGLAMSTLRRRSAGQVVDARFVWRHGEATLVLSFLSIDAPDDGSARVEQVRQIAAQVAERTACTIDPIERPASGRCP